MKMSLDLHVKETPKMPTILAGEVTVILMDGTQIKGLMAGLEIESDPSDYEVIKTVAGDIAATLYAPPQTLAESYSGTAVEDALLKMVPGIAKILTECPVVSCVALPAPLVDIIMHLNDTHTWTREQIADWLDEQDWDLTLNPVEKAKHDLSTVGKVPVAVAASWADVKDSSETTADWGAIVLFCTCGWNTDPGLGVLAREMQMSRHIEKGQG